jgi:hypothetical protein
MPLGVPPAPDPLAPAAVEVPVAPAIATPLPLASSSEPQASEATHASQTVLQSALDIC